MPGCSWCSGGGLLGVAEVLVVLACDHLPQTTGSYPSCGLTRIGDHDA